MDNIQKNFRDKSRLRGMGAPKQDLADGGKVKGKGGPTDDRVGPVALSDGEYVLPADTVEIVGRDNLDALRLATHEFVDDSNKPKVSGLRRMANGGPFYVTPDGVASRQSPPGRAVVPYRQPPAPATVTAPQPPVPATTPAPQVTAASGPAASGPAASGPAASGPSAAGPAAPANPASGPSASGPSGGGRVGNFFRGATRLAGNAVAPAFAAYDAFTDSPEARRRAASGQEGAAGVASQIGSYLGSALSFGTSSAQDIGAVTSALRGEGTGAYHAVPDAEKGWARRLGERFLPTESAEIMSDRVQLSDSAQAQTDLLSRHGIDLNNMSEDDYARARGIMGAPQSRPDELPGMTNVPDDVRTSSAGIPATPVQPGSYQNLRLAEMGVPVDQQNLAPVTEDTRRSLLREGGGTPGQYVNLGSYGGDTNIYGTASEPGGRINSFVGVGAGAGAGSGNRGNTLSSSALRGGAAPAATGQSGQRTGGGSRVTVVGPNDIDRRYDDMAKQLRGMYSQKGQGNLAKRLLQLEEQRMNAHNAAANTQATLRGQDINADTLRANAALQAETMRANSMDSLARSQDTALARVREAQLKALQDAQRQARDSEEKGFNRYTDAISRMFVDENGEVDTRKQEEFTSFLEGSDPQAFEKFSAMGPQDQMALLQDFKTLYDMMGPRNRTAVRGGGAVTNRMEFPEEVREASWDDYTNNNLPLSDYLWAQWVPGTNPNVVVGKTGQPTLLSDIAVDEDGNWDADKLNLIERRTGRSGLRD